MLRIRCDGNRGRERDVQRRMNATRRSFLTLAIALGAVAACSDAPDTGSSAATTDHDERRHDDVDVEREESSDGSDSSSDDGDTGSTGQTGGGGLFFRLAPFSD